MTGIYDYERGGYPPPPVSAIRVGFVALLVIATGLIAYLTGPRTVEADMRHLDAVNARCGTESRMSN